MTALQQIIKDAKKLRKASPRMEWKTAVKKAGAKYRAGAKKKPAAKKAAAKKRVVKKAVKRVSRKKVTGTGRILSGVGFSVTGAISAAKKTVLQNIGKLEATKFATKGVRAKRVIAKKIAEKKKQYRKFL